MEVQLNLSLNTFYLSLAMCSDYSKRPDIMKELQGDSTELPVVRDIGESRDF